FSSRSKIISTAPNESIPKSSSRSAMLRLRFSAGTLFAIIAITSAATSSMIVSRLIRTLSVAVNSGGPRKRAVYLYLEWGLQTKSDLTQPLDALTSLITETKRGVQKQRHFLSFFPSPMYFRNAAVARRNSRPGHAGNPNHFSPAGTFDTTP